ncbi:adenylosuccinate lyase [Pareuzebyella sediminis]|uniref:adenylosuccinate lyase n=1 Tax=Pareuzebyella sediminis TaxID=2607998 RepID=UPI0011EC4536|nr:adenylosuccinate lyase [Pareuzebyella sediminis]
MTKEKLHKLLEYVNASREKRAEMAAVVINHPESIGPLLKIGLDSDDPLSSRACWVLEFAVKKRLAYILPYIDRFTSSIHNLHLESSIRPMAKICELLMQSFFSGSDHEVHEKIADQHLERIAAACFDWLIGTHKVATKAYSMTCLFLVGKKFEWIHPELRQVIERHYAEGSAAYKARARHTLSALKKLEK